MLVVVLGFYTHRLRKHLILRISKIKIHLTISQPIKKTNRRILFINFALKLKKNHIYFETKILWREYNL